MAVSNSGHSCPCNVVSHRRRGLQPAAAAAWVLDNMNIDEQLWWGRQQQQQAAAHASHDSFNSYRRQTVLLHQCILSFFYSLLYCRLSYGFKRKITSFFKSETEGKDKQPKPRVLVTHDFLESREVAKVTKIKT